MKIELDKSDILDEIRNNYVNDHDFLLEIMDTGTTNWRIYQEVLISMIKTLSRQNLDISDILHEMIQE